MRGLALAVPFLLALLLGCQAGSPRTGGNGRDAVADADGASDGTTVPDVSPGDVADPREASGDLDVSPRADAGLAEDAATLPDDAATLPDDAVAELDDAASAPDDAASAPDDAAEPEVDDPCASADGTWPHPFCLPALPATVSGDTSQGATDLADSYSPCAPAIDESGPGVVYVVSLDQGGTLTAGVDDVPGDGVDVDVHLLTAPSADACVARGNLSLTAAVEAATYWIVVDTWFDGTSALVGPYTLQVTFQPAPTGDCPADMVPVGAACLDRFEAPNVAGELPLVMYTFTESEAWCAARGKRLCFEDEWTDACGGAAELAYPYGDARIPGLCNDAHTWLPYDQALLNGWPASASGTGVGTLEQLFAAARAVSPTAEAAADHVEGLYQGEGSGTNGDCTNEVGAFDLVGNVEEWTRRRNPVAPSFHGNLKGRYWADTRTCQDDITVHGDAFRFYEIGFRCCRDRE